VECSFRTPHVKHFKYQMSKIETTYSEDGRNTNDLDRTINGPMFTFRSTILAYKPRGLVIFLDCVKVPHEALGFFRQQGNCKAKQAIPLCYGHHNRGIR
jgi:hypothetical protein